MAWTEDRRMMGMAGVCHSHTLSSALSNGQSYICALYKNNLEQTDKMTTFSDT